MKITFEDKKFIFICRNLTVCQIHALHDDIFELANMSHLSCRLDSLRISPNISLAPNFKLSFFCAIHLFG